MLASSGLHSKRYFALLASIIGLTVLAPIVEHGFWARMLVGCLMFITLWTASAAVASRNSVSPRSLALAIFAGLLWAVGFFAEFLPFNAVFLHYVTYGVLLLFFGNIGRIMLEDILQGEANFNRICGGVCVFVLLGLCFAMLHMMVAAGDPGAYRDNYNTPVAGSSSLSREYQYPLFVYFSFCTLSTVGYGDIVPISRLARSCAMVEAMTGQLYLAILVARLVGLHIAGTSTNNQITDEKTKRQTKQLEASLRK